MTPAPGLVGLFVVPLSRGGIEYMVTGAFTALWPADEFYVPPVAVVAEESARSGAGHCKVIHSTTMLRADVHFAGDDELAAWALGRRVVRVVQGEAVQFAPIEYVILSKLRCFRDDGSDRHLRDIARMLEVSGPEVDRPLLEAWVGRLDLAGEWAQARSYEGSA